MPASGPRSHGARSHPRPCQGNQPWPRTSAAPGLVLATQKLDSITRTGTRAKRGKQDHVTDRVAAREHHRQPVDPDAAATGWRHSVRERLDEVRVAGLGLLGPRLALGLLRGEAL